MGFLLDISRAVEAIVRIQSATTEQLGAAAQTAAEELEQNAKQNAPWTDRTGNARRTLEGFVISEGDVLSIGVCGNMPYSPQLEVGYGGRYSVLVPTLDAAAPNIINRIRQIVAGIGGADVESN